METKPHDFFTTAVTEMLAGYCNKQNSFTKRNMSIVQNNMRAYIACQIGALEPEESEFLLFSFLPAINKLASGVDKNIANCKHLYIMLADFEIWLCEITTTLILAA